MECPHDCVNASVCVDCGLSIQSEQLLLKETFSKNHGKYKEIYTKSLEKDLNALNIPFEIKEWVKFNLIERCPNMFKAPTRTKVIFAYAYLAHLHLGISIDPWNLAYQIGIDRVAVEDAIKMASGIASSGPSRTPTASVVVMSPESCIEMFTKNSKFLPEDIKQMKTFAVEIVKKNSLLLDEDPKKVAAGIIRLYCEKMSIPLSSINVDFGFPNAVTRKYSNMVEKY